MSEADSDLEDDTNDKIKEAISVFQPERAPSRNEIYNALPPRPMKTNKEFINVGSETSSNKIHPIV